MSINRTKLSWEGHYTMVPNTWARDQRLSRKARGLLTELLSHKVGWKVTTKALVKAGREGRDSVGSAIEELVTLGYLVQVQEREGGQFAGVSYDLSAPHEEPVLDPEDDDEDSDSTVNGFSRDGEIRTAESGLTVNGKPAPKKNIFKENQEKSQSVNDTTTGQPVDNSAGAGPTDRSSFWAERKRRRALKRDERSLDVEQLEETAGALFAEFDRPRHILLLTAYGILGKASKAGTTVFDPTAYVIASLRAEPEVHRQAAFNLEGPNV
jgi:hypothetical protein